MSDIPSQSANYTNEEELRTKLRADYLTSLIWAARADIVKTQAIAITAHEVAELLHFMATTSESEFDADVYPYYVQEQPFPVPEEEIDFSKPWWLRPQQ